MSRKQPGLGCCQCARCGSRFEQPNWKTRRGVTGGNAAARQHDKKITDKTDLIQPGLQLRQVIGDPLLYVDIRHGRARALKLADLRNHFGTEGNTDVRRDFSDDLRSTPFMDWIPKAV